MRSDGASPELVISDTTGPPVPVIPRPRDLGDATADLPQA